MPIRNQNQKTRNVITNDGVYPGVNESLVAPLVRGVRLRRRAGQWVIYDNPEAGSFRVLPGNQQYEPPFVCRGISTNDPNTDGQMIQIDTQESTQLEMRIYAGVILPILVTRVYCLYNNNIDDIILWK